ncbi:hypothetical protein Tco_0550984 [Tanacetum coccineum]
MSNVKKSIAERTCHKRLYDRRVNKKKMQTQESKVDTGKALDADLVVTERVGPNQNVKFKQLVMDHDIDLEMGLVRRRSGRDVFSHGSSMTSCTSMYDRGFEYHPGSVLGQQTVPREMRQVTRFAMQVRPLQKLEVASERHADPASADYSLRDK